MNILFFKYTNLTIFFNFYTKISKNGQVRRKIVAETPMIRYEGNNYDSNFSNSFQKYYCLDFIVYSIYFGIFDPANNNLDITKLDRIYSLDSTVKHYKSEVKETDKERSYLEKRQDLITAFGNKKSKNQLKKETETKVDETNTASKNKIKKILKKQGEIMREKIAKRKKEEKLEKLKEKKRKLNESTE